MVHLVLVSILGSCLLSAVLVPIVRALFRRWGIVDRPDKERKLHEQAVALGGGLAVFVSVLITFVILINTDKWLGMSLLTDATTPLATVDQGTADYADLKNPHRGPVDNPVLWSQWLILFGAAGVLMVVGLLDDAIALRGRQKLLLQILVVVAIVGGGTVVQSFNLLGYDISLGIFAYPVTVLWLLAAINALNLLDGADAMASTVGAIISGGLAVLCVQTGNPLGALVAAALAGSLVGFLFYNRPPATIYLGDAGSMVIGLLIGVISIWGAVKGSTLVSFAPMMVLTLPLFDSAVAILRRVLTGRGIFATDRGHLHHRLLDRFSHRMMLLVVAMLCGISTTAAILSVHLNQQWIAVSGMLLVLGLLVFTGSFGSAELRMLLSQMAHFGSSLVSRNRPGEPSCHHRAFQLQGERCWDSIWLSLVDFAIEHGLVQIKLDVGIAWMQEGYHGSWRRVQMPDKVDQAFVRLPLFMDGRQVGRIEAIGDGRHASIGQTLQLLIERSEALDLQIQRLMRGEQALIDDEASPSADDWNAGELQIAAGG